MRRLFLPATLLLAMAPAAMAQSSRPASGGAASSSANTGYPAGTALGTGNATLLNGLTAPNAAVSLSGNAAAGCSADTSCASFPLTPLGATDPSLTPRLSPMIGPQANQTTGTMASPTISGTLSPASGLSPTTGALPSPGADMTLDQTSGLAPGGGLNRTSNPAIATPAAPTGGTPAASSTGTAASRAPSLSGSGFQSQCASSTSCSAFQ